MQKKYSDWLKVDLHIHTDYSNQTKTNDYKGTFSIGTLRQKLAENNVNIFSLTDHNIINTEAYKAYYNSYDSNNDALLLVGVELDILVKTKKYHTLLIFNCSTIEECCEISECLENKYAQNKITEKTNRVLELGDLSEVFKNYEYFFIPHAGNDRSIVAAYSSDITYAQRMVLLMPSVAFEKVKEARRSIYSEGFNKQRNLNNQSNDDIAYINFSDNHCCTNYPCTGRDGKNHEFYYIKGSKNYDSIRLAFIDPESRIKSESQLAKIQSKSTYIHSLRFKNNESISDCSIEFSPHLNVMIGGRSSGKSLLMYVLGEKINRTIPGGIKDKYQSMTINADIKLSNDTNYQTNTSLINKDEVIYLNQGDVVKYFEEKKLEDLARESNQYDMYQQKKSNFIIHKNRLQTLLNNIVSDYKNVDAVTQSPIYKLSEQIIKHQLSSKYVFKVNSSRDTQDLLLEIDQAEELVEGIVQSAKLLNKNRILKIQPKETLVIEKFIELLEQKRQLLITKKKLISKKEKFNLKVQDIIDSKNSTLDDEAQLKAQAELEFNKLVRNASKRFNALRKLKNSTQLLQRFDYTLKEEIKISNDVTLVLQVFKKQEILDLIIDGFKFKDNKIRSSLYSTLLQLLHNKITVKNYPDGDKSPETLQKKISVQLEELLKSIAQPKDYLSYSDGSTSIKNSPGYNSEKYLEIILCNDSIKYIFIDQPEDNLGNSFISKKLVKIIRKERFGKQIFLVTHNPSIVVYGDAESVIIAENNSNIISYKQVVLEDESSQKDICDSLDGGQYIFDMRARKYNIQKLLKQT